MLAGRFANKGEKMQKLEVLLFSLKGSKTLCVEAKDGNIDAFAYELFTKFDHIVNESDQSILLNEIQQNSVKT